MTSDLEGPSEPFGVPVTVGGNKKVGIRWRNDLLTDDRVKRVKIYFSTFDFPTINGYDSDSSKSMGEVGVCGVAIDTIEDMERLFEGIPLDQVTTSMTINMPAPVLLAMYLAVGENRGIPKSNLGGTVQMMP